MLGEQGRIRPLKLSGCSGALILGDLRRIEVDCVGREDIII